MRSWGAHRSTSAAMEEQPNARRAPAPPLAPPTASLIPPAQRPGKIRPAPSTGSFPHAMGDEKPTIGNFAGPHSPAALTPLAGEEDEVVGRCRAPGFGCHHAHTCRIEQHVKVVWRRRAVVMAASRTYTAASSLPLFRRGHAPPPPARDTADWLSRPSP